MEEEEEIEGKSRENTDVYLHSTMRERDERMGGNKKHVYDRRGTPLLIVYKIFIELIGEISISPTLSFSYSRVVMIYEQDINKRHTHSWHKRDYGSPGSSSQLS
uniref:Ovule protein n=1 Tax=Caenorhabditis tropicalis TaxID=1561998 RepID=A0A1I7TWK8_9PELO